MTCRLHLTGASGAGTTTLGRAVAGALSVPHADADDYFWVPTSPAYVEQREPADRLRLMNEIFVPRPAWVLSGSMLGWGDEIVERCDGVVFLTLDPEVRLARLEARQLLRRGGAPIDDATSVFLAWARGYDDPGFDGRSRVRHEEWLDDLDRPVLRLDSALPVDVLCAAVVDWAAGLQGRA
ncbi:MULTISPECIES: hypothetical protein [unclassified Nocardioides]|uniref:hypothetical protein n=1 Tax=unclassified Nocardioides TaxID=2615069 RepID=UPI003014F754